MAVDKLVDSAQLDSDLEDVADAIRAKSGGSSPLAFPAGFVSEIGSIQTGGDTPPSELPAGYTQLKYVRSTGTQGVDTGVSPTMNSKIQAQFFYTALSSYAFSMGSQNPPVGLYTTSSLGAQLYWNFGNKTDQTTLTGFPCASDSIPIATIDKDSATIVQQPLADYVLTIGATSMTENPNTHIGIFCRGNNGSFERNSSIQLYRAKIWDGETLIRDFVPALHDASQEIGLYDIVNNVFYHNIGTGVFIGGEY